jgi:hypothetical protein
LDDSERLYTTLLRMAATLRAQLALTTLRDPQRDKLYRDLLACYHELLAIHRRRLDACRTRHEPPT